MLDPEVEQLLVTLVDAAAAVDRPHRRFFVANNDSSPGVFVHGGGLPGFLEAAPQDLIELDELGYVTRENFNIAGTYELFITPAGNDYVRQVKGRVDPVAATGQTALDYIDHPEFATRPSRRP